MELFLAFDDIDSLFGGCTTHFTAKLFYTLIKSGYKPKSLPHLIRLNPDIPWKTRGNAATVIVLDTGNDGIESIKELVSKSLHDYLTIEEASAANTQPAILIGYVDKQERQTLIRLYREAIINVVPPDLVWSILSNLKSFEVIAPYGRRGVVGALSAIGAVLAGEDIRTYELLRYVHTPLFDKTNVSTPFIERIYRVLDESEYIDTFSHVDREEEKLLVVPSGVDPVLYGLRGRNPLELIRLDKKLSTYFHIETFWLIYKTNQATNAHLNVLQNKCSGSYVQTSILTHYKGVERVVKGGHTYFKLSNDTTTTAIAFYESGEFRKTLSKFREGDILLQGNCYGDTIKIEGGVLLRISSGKTQQNPICPKCFRVMESMGVDKGYRCRRCKYIIMGGIKGEYSCYDRIVTPFRLVEPTRYQRHLTKPLKNYGYILNFRYEKIVLDHLMKEIWARRP